MHNQEETSKLDNEMKMLAEETSKVTRKLTVITENSANDGEVVRVITIVSAIYLPGSFVTVSCRMEQVSCSIDASFSFHLGDAGLTPLHCAASLFSA